VIPKLEIKQNLNLKLGVMSGFSTEARCFKEFVMTRSKIAAFFQEFSFLRNFFWEEEIVEAYVSRVKPELFDVNPAFELVQSDDILFLSERVWRCILLIGDANITVEVGLRQIEKKWYNPKTWSGKIRFYETVGKAMSRIGGNVHFIIDFEPLSRRLTVIKPPKGYTVGSWLKEIQRQDAAEIKMAIADIDSDAADR
jgi:hypothetical protein